MKRKYISMMLFGASVSLVTPSLAVCAEEAIGIEANEEATTEEGEILSEYNANETVEETEESFADRLVDVTFKQEVFGDISVDLTMLLVEIPADGLTLKEYEEKIFEKIEEMSLENKLDVQYYTAVAFEEVYGDAAEEAGRAMRYRYLSEKAGSDFSSQFEEMDTYSLDEIDALIKAVVGAPVKPVDAKSGSESENVETETESAAEDGTILLDDNQEPPSTEESTSESVNLKDYVEGIGDISIVVGESVPTSYKNLDPSIVEDVKWDLSQIDLNKEGTYPIYVTIYGTDGTTAGPFEYTCTVNADTQLLNKKEQMKKALDEIDISMLEEDSVSEWNTLLEDAKSRIDGMESEEEMQAVVDEMNGKRDDLLNKQELAKAKAARRTEINAYFEGLSFKTDALHTMGENALNEIISQIESCSSISELDDVLREGKAKLDSIVNTTEETLDDLKANAKTDIGSMKADSATGTKMDDMIEKVCSDKIDNAKDADEISKILNTSRSVFEKLKAYKSDKTQFMEMFKELKGIAADTDTTQLLDDMARQVSPSTDKEAEDMVTDACKGISANVEDFIAYLSGKAGENIAGETKAEAYKNYVEFLKNGGSEVKEKLEQEKTAAKDRIQAMVDKISDTTLKAEAQKAADAAYTQLELAQTVEEVSSIENDVKAEIEALANASDEEEKLQKVKDDAISQIDRILTEQQDSPLYDALYTMSESAKRNVKNALSAEEVEIILSTFTTDVELVVKENTAELAKAKSEALANLSSLMTAYNSKYVTSKAQGIINQARKAVEAAKTSADCKEAYKSAKEEFDKVCLQSMKDAFVKDLNSLIDNSTLKDDNLSKAKEIVAKAVENINKVTSPTKESVMQAIYNQAKTSVNEITENASKAGQELQKVKEDAKKELENYVTNASGNASKVVSTYKNKIESAQTEEEVKARLEEAKKLLDQIGAHTSNAPGINNNTNTNTTSNLVNDPNATVEDVRAAALSELKAYVTNNSDNAEEIVKKYSESIKSATSKEKINELLKEAKSKLDAIGAHGEKVGEKRGEPEAKSSQNSISTSDVKTGDMNGSVFAMLFAAITSSLGLIGAAIFKKSRQ